MQALFVAVQQIRSKHLADGPFHQGVTAVWIGGTTVAVDWQNAMMQAPSKPQAEPRTNYKVFSDISTRWSDNDVYGHVNNVVYYSWFDTAVNAYLIDQGVLDITQGSTIGLVVETQCNYFASLAFPQKVQAGIRVAKLGTSSVRYEVGIFGEDALTAAKGHFIHVYVDAQTRKPVPLPLALKTVLEKLV
jgi:acyl-CoA thioester hydrolase